MNNQVFITCEMTVDGLIEAPVPAPEGWLSPEGDHAMADFEQFVDAAALLLGRKCYEGFAAVWPKKQGGQADHLNSPKYVASRTLTSPLTWNATLIGGDVVEGVKQLKSDLDGDLLVSGCGTFARFLVENGLVDEVRFWVHPSVRGPGDRPFHDGPPIDLDLVGVERFNSGVAHLRYRPIPA